MTLILFVHFITTTTSVTVVIVIIILVVCSCSCCDFMGIVTEILHRDDMDGGSTSITHIVHDGWSHQNGLI